MSCFRARERFIVDPTKTNGLFNNKIGLVKLWCGAKS